MAGVSFILNSDKWVGKICEAFIYAARRRTQAGFRPARTTTQRRDEKTALELYVPSFRNTL